MGSFAEDFLRGLMIARQQKEQKRQGDMEQQQMLINRDLQQAQLRRQGQQDQRQGVLDQQGQARDILGLLQSQPMPREEMPAGQAGPAAPAPRSQIGFPLLGGGTQQITPQYAEDVAAQQRAAEDLKIQRESELARVRDAAKNLNLPPALAARLGLDASQPVDPAVAQLAAGVGARDEAAAGRRDAREASAAQTKAIRDAAESGKQFTRAGQLADNYRSETAYKNYATVAPQYEIVRSAAADPSGASDLSLIFSYMKILDPGSTVREGEFANAQNSGGIPDKIKAKYNQIISGERLSQAQRDDFASQAGRVFKNYEAVKRVIDRTYEERAKRSGLNPEDVIVTFPTSEQAGGGGGGGAPKRLRYNPATGQLE